VWVANTPTSVIAPCATFFPPGTIIQLVNELAVPTNRCSAGPAPREAGADDDDAAPEGTTSAGT